jgi:uncharacterized protein (TIGR02391 family)
MARGQKEPQLRPANLSREQMATAITKIDRRIVEIDSFDVDSVVNRSEPKIGVLSSKLDSLLLSVFGPDSVEYNRYRWPITNLDTASINMMGTPLHEVQQGLRRGLETAKSQLEAIRSGFLEEIEDSSGLSPSPSTRQDVIGLSGLHTEIAKKCAPLLDARAYPEAVERSFKIVRDRLRKLTGYETASEAFGKGKLFIEGAAAPNVESDFNQGAKFLMMALDMFRNEKSHTSEGNIHDLEHAYQYLMLSSLALRFLDRARVI